MFTGNSTNTLPRTTLSAGFLCSENHLPQPLADRKFRQVEILHDCPHDGQATGLGGKGINLISPLPHIAEKAFNCIGTANVAMHDRRKRIKHEEMLFIFAQAADSLGIPLLIFRLECAQIEKSLLFLLLFPDTSSFCGDLLPLPVRNDTPAHCVVYAPYTVGVGSR